MKLLQKNISSKDAFGSIKLLPETADDLWHTYNLLQPETDLVLCSTLRKVINTSTTGSTTSKKIRTKLKICVSKVDFDPKSLQVRISGKNTVESKYIRMGAHHTLTLELGRDFIIEKECWDQIYLDRIEEACNPERQADICGLVMQPGLAHLCLVTGSITITKAKIEMAIPKKRRDSSNHSKALVKFFDTIYYAILQQVDLNKVKCVICASPGYLKDDFYNFIVEQSVKRQDRSFILNKRKFVVCKTSSGHKYALQEAFGNPCIFSRINETKFAKEIKVLNLFMRMIDKEPDRAYYGYNDVFKANSELAVHILLVTDGLFLNSDLLKRKKYVSLVESVRENGGEVYILSVMHVSGKQLQQVSGVAAILRYPLPDLYQIETDTLA